MKKGSLNWQKMGKQQIEKAERFLREQELTCVAACHRFLKRSSARDAVWVLQSRDNNIHGLLVYSNQLLLPVFTAYAEIPEPGFLNRFFGVIPVRSIQGLFVEVMFIERFLSKCGLEAIDKIDYDYMYIDKTPEKEGFLAGPKKLVIRNAQYSDIDAISVLQAGYEQEEVLPRGAVFNPAASRLNTEKILVNEQLMLAELDGQPVGKINTSALSFTRFQIGGVYVLPNYRNMGIARRMTTEFVNMLINQGKGVSLFVKKSNPQACSVYRRLGFNFLADYRITYF